MPTSTTTDSFDFIGTGAGDIMVDGFRNLQGQTLQAGIAAPVSANGREGKDRITTGAGNDLAAGLSAACVEIIWNGEVIDTVEAGSGAFETFSVDVVSTGVQGALGFRTAEVSGATACDFDGPIISYEKAVILGVEEIRVDAFAAGQSNLYQVIDGQLHVFDVEAQEYTRIGDAPPFKINAVGFKIEDDLIYGVAKSDGTDTLGNEVSATDIVMIDARGDTYRLGEGFYGDYVGDFDNAGNLWTFHSALDRISVVDVDRRDADGSPHIDHFKFPGDMFSDRTFDIAYV